MLYYTGVDIAVSSGVANENDSCWADWPPKERSACRPQPGFHQRPGRTEAKYLEKCMDFSKTSAQHAAFLFQLTRLVGWYMCEWMSAFVSMHETSARYTLQIGVLILWESISMKTTWFMVLVCDSLSRREQSVLFVRQTVELAHTGIWSTRPGPQVNVCLSARNVKNTGTYTLFFSALLVIHEPFIHLLFSYFYIL